MSFYHEKEYHILKAVVNSYSAQKTPLKGELINCQTYDIYRPSNLHTDVHCSMNGYNVGCLVVSYSNSTIKSVRSLEYYEEPTHSTKALVFLHHGLSLQGVWVLFWTPKP